MRTPRPAGFSIVEALVATVLLGVAGSALATSLAVTRALRTRSLAERTVARTAATLAAQLARRPCAAADTSGAGPVGASVRERWTATHAGDGWQWVDSVFAAGARRAAGVAGSITCR